MRKNVWKRLLAAVLSAVIVFTSVDASGLVVNAAEEGTTTTKTLGEIVATHNGVSDDVEKSVLSHPDLAVNGTTFAYDDQGELVVPKIELSDNITMSVDSETNVTTITVPDYNDDPVVWSALSVTVNNSGNKTVLTEAEGTENVYLFNGTVEEVVVTYGAYINVDSDEQLDLLNTAHYLVSARNVLSGIFGDSNLMTYAERIELGTPIVSEIATKMVEEDTVSAFAGVGIEVPEAAFVTLAQETAEDSDIANTFKLYSLSSYYDSDKPVAFWDAKVDDLIDSFDDSEVVVGSLINHSCFDDIAAFFDAVDSLDATVKESIGSELETISDSATVISEYKEALGGYYDNDTVISFADDKEKLYAEKSAATEGSNLLKENATYDITLPRTASKKTSCADEKIVLHDGFEITRLGTARVITVEVNAYVVEDNVLITEPITVTGTIPAKVGDDETIVKENAKATVKGLLAGIGYGLTGEDVYGELDHYTMVEEDVTAIAGGVTSNATISFTYKPNEYTVTCTDENGESVDPAGEYYYGYVITFPSAEEGSYNYKAVAGAEGNYYQGKPYTVVSDAEFKRITNDTTRTIMNENMVAAETYADDLKTQGVKILKNNAVKSTKEIEALDPKDASKELLLSFGEEELTVNQYDDGVNKWIPRTVVFVNGDEESEPVEVVDGKVALPEEYTHLNVEYVLEIEGVNASEVANIPAVLVSEAKTQLGALNSVVGYADDLADINNIVLNALKTSLENGVASGEDIKATTIEAVDFILNRSNGLIDNNGNLILSSIADTYRNKDNSAKLAYYYTGDNAATVKKQVGDIAAQLSIVVADTAAMEYLRTVELTGVGSLDSYITELVDATDKLDDLEDRFLSKNSLIDSDATEYTELLGYLAEATNSNMVGTVTTGDTLYWISSVTASAPDYFNVKVVVKTSTSSKDAYVKGFKKDDTITEADVAAIKAAVAASEAELVVSDKYYTCSPVKDLDSLEGTVVTSDINLVYTWTPKTYTIKFVEEVGGTEITPSATFSYGSFLINLPSAPEGYEYIYDINGNDVKQTEGHSIREDFVALFNDGATREITITAEKINLALKAEEDFFQSLQEAVEGTGISVIPERDAATSRVTSVELAIDAANNASIAEGMQKFVMALVKESAYSEYLLGDYVVMGADGITLQGIIDAVIASGINTVDLAAMFDKDGNVVNNKVLETTFAYNSASEENEVPFYITYNANGANADRAKLKAGLDKMNKVVVVEGTVEETMARSRAAIKKPIVVATVKEPYSRNAYEAYLVAMVLEGRTTFDEIAAGEVALKDIVDFEYDRLIDDLKADKDNITIKTVANTIAKLNKNVDLSEYEDTFNKLKKFIFSGDGDILASTDSGSVVFEATDDEKAYNEYRMLGTVDKAVVFEYLDAEDLASLVSDEEYKVAVKVVVEGMGEEYAAAVINDPRKLENITGANVESAKLAANTINLLTEDELAGTTVAANAMVILLTDADKVTLAGNAIVDLNGNNLGEVAGTEGTIVLVDSTYNNEGSVATLSANVKDGRLTAEDDCYTVDVVRDNNTKEIVELDVYLDAGFLEKAGTIEMPELKVLACELAFDLIMNNITSCDMVVTGEKGTYDLYDVDIIDDIFAFVADGKEDIVNAALNAVDYQNLTAFVNEIIDTLSLEDGDTSAFAKLASATRNGDAFATYGVATTPVRVNLDVAGEGDDNYFTAGIETEDDTKNFTVKFFVSGDAAEKESVAKLFDDLAKVVETCKLSVNLDGITYTNGNIAAIDARANGDIVVNLITEDNSYAVAFATIVASGLSENGDEGDVRKDLISAVNAWLATPNKETNKALRDAVDGITVAQLIKAVKAAYNKDFADITSILSTTPEKATKVEAIYHDLLNVLYRITGIMVNRLGIDGNETKLQAAFGMIRGVSFGTYVYGDTITRKGVTASASLELKLFVDIEDDDNQGGNQPGGNGGGSGSSDKDDKDEPEYVGTYTPPTSGSTGASTGDANNTTLWIALMGLAIVAVVVAYTKKKRKAE